MARNDMEYSGYSESTRLNLGNIRPALLQHAIENALFLRNL